MELTIIKHTSLTMENKMKKRKALDDRDSGEKTYQTEWKACHSLSSREWIPSDVNNGQHKRERGATVSQHREHSIMRERRKKTKDELRFRKIQAADKSYKRKKEVKTQNKNKEIKIIWLCVT